MSDRMSEEKWDELRRELSAGLTVTEQRLAVDEGDRARTREAELERDARYVRSDRDRLEEIVRDERRRAEQAEAKSAALERENERLRTFVGKLARLETRPHDAETWNGRALVVIRDDARAALSPPKETL